MNQRKNKVLLILIIILLVILLIGGTLYAYLVTDLFKSNKDLFFKYASNILDTKSGIIDNSVMQYFEKKKGTPYENDGTFTMDINSDNINSERVKDFNISFSGHVDEANSKNMQDISLNYSDSVNFPFSYKMVANKIGLQTKYVGNKYLAIDTEKSENLSGSSDISNAKNTLSEIEKVQKISNIELSEEEKNNIKTTYIDFINNELGNDKFSKVNENGTNGYKLILSGEELKNIITKILEKLKDDQTTLDKLNEYLKTQKNSAKITTSDIDDLIEKLENDIDLNDEKFEITVYAKQRKVIKLLIATNEYKVYIEKSVNQGEIKYQIALEATQDNETAKIYFNCGFSGLASEQTVNEKYELGLETAEGQYKYQFNNNINFVENINVEEFSDENALMLSNYNPEVVSNFISKVMERIKNTNKEQMEQLGLQENENPLITGIMAPILSLQTQAGSLNSMNEATNQMNELEIGTFNQKFEVYESTKQSPQTITGLLSTIQLNNESAENDRKIKEINFNGEEYDSSEQNIAFIKEDLKNDKEYRVVFEKDQDTGAIYRVVISER